MKKLLLIIIVVSGLFTFTSKASACPFAQKDIEESKRKIKEITLSVIWTYDIGNLGSLEIINFYKNYLVRVMQVCPSIAIKYNIPQHVDLASSTISFLKTRQNRTIPPTDITPVPGVLSK